VAVGVGKGDAIAGDGTQAGADPEQLSAAEPVPHFDNDEHTGKADSEPGDDPWLGRCWRKMVWELFRGFLALLAGYSFAHLGIETS